MGTTAASENWKQPDLFRGATFEAVVASDQCSNLMTGETSGTISGTIVVRGP
jgi:hypothetical protein